MLAHGRWSLGITVKLTDRLADNTQNSMPKKTSTKPTSAKLKRRKPVQCSAMVRAQRPITGSFQFKDVDDLAKWCEPRPWHEYYQAGFIAGLNACRELLIRNAP